MRWMGPVVYSQTGFIDSCNYMSVCLHSEVQKFPEALRKSSEVQFAIAVHSAVAERNHVRFFRLIRQADCLTVCLLHRYFGQVRSHALLALSSAFYGHPRHEVIASYLFFFWDFNLHLTLCH